MYKTLVSGLMNESALMIAGKRYRIAEVEIYHYEEDHADPYVHKHPDQLTTNKWYFHRASDSTVAKYRGGTYKGLDLTRGTEGANNGDSDDGKGERYFGILIRSIYDCDGTLIEGPCRVVDFILKQYKMGSIIELTNDIRLDALQNEHNFIVAPFSWKKKHVSSGIRVGLSSKHPEWAQRHYRFTIYKNKLKKKISRSFAT